ncbi:MAG: DUF4426 domain-containing protein [Gammaproteobacteria bacterium]|nr:DUF4426 domain-containing protein [Gammaproteobacteria bacterium]
MRVFIKSLVIIFSFILMTSVSYAESSAKVGGYTVHYNALSTESLPASVAKAYKIKRSKNRGFLNISILKDGAGFQGVEAELKVVATNLTGQLREMEIRKITEQNAVYYISEFSVSDRETLDFIINVTTLDNTSANIKLRQQFFAN